VSVALLVAALSSTLAFATAPVAAARVAKRGAVPARLIAVSVSVDRAHPGAQVAPGFLGLSFEMSSLPQFARDSGAGDLVMMLRSLGAGVLRFGGVTADERVAWSDGGTARPAWAPEVLDAADLSGLGALAANSGWHVLLTVGLGHYEPEQAAREAASAKAALGSSLQAIELGNEPDSYARHGLRPEPWGVVQYDEQLAAYRGAIEAAAPGIPLAGPDVSGSSAFEKWGPSEVVNQRPIMLTGHHYPLGCGQVPAPSITELLSAKVRALEVGSLRRYMTIAELGETPFRLDETNSVSCGGEPGISNTFASALWAVSYLTEAMGVGVAGINFQGNPTNCGGYTPLCALTPEDLAMGTFEPQPEWYALLLAKELIGDRPVETFIRSPPQTNLQVATFLAEDGSLQFVIIDDDLPGARSLSVRLRVGRAFAGASVLSLTGPSPTALTGVELGGRAVASDGSWSEPSRLPYAANRDGSITVRIKPSSAALVTVSPTG
jgi:hypothetical protein